MAQSKCLITGCWLSLPSEGKRVWGDLHASGSALVFNAVLTPDTLARSANRGDAAWEYSPPAFLPHEKSVEIPASFPYFERRGVIVFDKYNAIFNSAATQYIRGRCVR